MEVVVKQSIFHIKYHLVHSLYSQKNFDFDYWPTPDIVADILTNPLIRILSETFCVLDYNIIGSMQPSAQE